MARSSNESTSDLFIRLGLSYDELESGFVNAERTIRDNMTRLQRENQIIELQAQVEILGLDETADAERILEIRMRALNEQIEKQKDRVRLATAELQNMIDRTGENSDQTQRARLALERERLALAQLENQLSSLGETQEETNEGAAGLRQQFEKLAEKAAPVVAGIVAITGAMAAAYEMTNGLIERFQELQTQSAKLNLPITVTDDFLRKIRLAGGEIEDVMGYIRGISDAMVKGETDDPEWIALTRYGAQIFDATGRLKNFKQLFEETRQAFEKARAEGNEIEFLQMTGGESGVTDAIQAFTNWNQAVQDADKIFKSGFDTKRLQNAQRQMALLSEQTDEFRDALASVVEPAVTIAVENLFEVFRAGTQIVAENREEIFKWGDALVRAIAHASGFGNIYESVFSLKDANRALKGFKESWADFRREDEEMSRRQSANNNPLHQYAEQRTKGLREEFEDLRAELDSDGNEYKQQLQELELWKKRAYNQTFLSTQEREAIENLYSAKLEKIEHDRAEKLKEIREGIAADERTALENRLADIDKEREDWIKAGMEEAEATVHAEKMKQQAWDDAISKANEYLDEVLDAEYEKTHSAFENQLRDIEKWKDAQLEKAETAEEVAATITSAAMKEAEAFEREMDRIQGKVESGQDQLARLTLSRYENDIRETQKKYVENLADNMPANIAGAIYKETIRSIQRQRAQDTSGDYTRRPEGAGNYSELINLDARELALAEILNKSRSSIEELDHVMADASSANDQHILSLKELVAGTGTASGALTDAAGEIDSAAADIKNSLDDAADVTGKSGARVSSAVETYIKALKLLQNIEAAKAARESASPFKEKPAPKKAEIIYGDDENRCRENGIEIIYGDDEQVDYGLDELDIAAQGAAESLDKFNVSLTEMLQKAIAENAPTAEPESSLPQAAEPTPDIVKPKPDSENTPEENPSTTETNDDAGKTTAEKLLQAAEALDEAGKTSAEKLMQAADAIDKVREKLLQMPVSQPVAPKETDDTVQKALKGTETVGGIIAAIGAVTLQPEIAAIGAVIQALADTAAGLREAAGYNQPVQASTQVQPQQQPTQALAQDLSPAVQELKNQTTVLGEIKTVLQELRQQPATDNTQSLAQQFSTSFSELRQNIAQAVTDGTQRFIQSVSEQTQSIMQAITEQTSQMVQALDTVSQAMTESARALTESRASQNQSSTPNVSPTVNNNINLGGAYVFDNTMKRQLTDDIAGEVANAVTSAVRTATSQSNFGYGT